ncbi:beta-N-acetylhexosaminidase [Acrocarpospora phusangensis]|uniref:beta-N-acetylhexosaminidase n=1 Tax=Acrocarpospora phusangensis TaxID=1070424 RepID=A0A919Q9S2_9ACTN|nr:beta-N-acetylhexosaminidase [Acrocarpospora phusangensis]GIH24653.1 beta-N-acetylhexosaminidase [Acrocarpospora phusangensis]
MDTLLPRPRSTETVPGAFSLAAGALVAGPADLSGPVRLALAVLDLARTEDGTAPVRVVRDAGLGPEAYAVTVTEESVTIAAGDAAGAFYAGQTLRQLLPVDAFRAAPLPGTVWEIPCGRITDAPALAWRGVHLDVSRHFLPKREVFRMIDIMAVHKLNRLHLHLVDDQGWRVESPSFPLLHEISSHRPRTTTSYYNEPLQYDDIPHGGFYTLTDLTEISAYARARAVTVVPEIDVPGHASAILAAYPHLGSDPAEAHHVEDRWGIFPALLSPLPPTVDFLTTIFGEVMDALGEVPYFHIGGDECVLDGWAAAPEIVAYQRDLGLDRPADLHAWFLRHLADRLAERGSRAVVWDEAFVSGRLRQDTVIMPWRGMNVARRAAAAGHDVVLTPVFPLYFDYAEASDSAEPLAIGDATTLADVAAFAPVPETWTPQERAQVVGAQFQLWSERIPDGRTLDYRAWPRGCAVAEISWTGAPAHDLPARLPAHLRRLDALGVEYRPLDGPRPWQRGGGWRAHRPGRVPVHDVMRGLEEATASADHVQPTVS